MSPSHSTRIRWSFLAAAVLVVLLALVSPLNALANGVLFSAHMTQHILLLLIAPALVWLSLNGNEGGKAGCALAAQLESHSTRGAASAPPTADPSSGPGAIFILLGWVGGVGSMWVWHAPALCDAAATSSGVHALQVVSLLGFGLAFWRPILAPRERDQLGPGAAIIYLFTACLACTALGIILTLTPIEVCAAFRAPLAAGNRWSQWRESIGYERDRQIGGLLMWVPMCLVYLAAILWEFARWMAAPAVRKGNA